ncbi:MAG: hypothetical protein Q9222_007651 [Ikaeria aurantiellina]
MKLFLIRHGETVDNVAGVYAGVKDSALTVQGVLQAERLGQYLATAGSIFTHVYASDLQRAVKTAEALLAAQPENPDRPALTVRQLSVLREQDFGIYEGKPFYVRQQGSSRSGKDNHRAQHLDDPGFQDVESKESMTSRTDSFVHEYLKPLILKDSPSSFGNVVAIVSHGIILSYLWRSLLGVFAKQTVSLAPGLAVGDARPLEFLGGWSNTGYLELEITSSLSSATAIAPPKEIHLSLAVQFPAERAEAEILPPSYRMLVKAVNAKDHLKGLKRARGVGSSQYNEGQKKIESFFKKTKVG